MIGPVIRYIITTLLYIGLLLPPSVICEASLSNNLTKKMGTVNFLPEFQNVKEVRRYEVLISNDNTTKVLHQFWKNTGMCPPDPHQQAYRFFLSNDMKQNLFHIGSLPFKGIARVRIHWLLDLIKIRTDTDSTIVYDYTYLDQLIHELWKNDLYLGFELMGNPSNMYTDFENATQLYMWKDLVKALAKQYIALYGIKYLMKWNFETWNEPDHHDFDRLNFTIQGFLNYYDACSEGLKEADKRLKFGGPGGSCRVAGRGKSPICWALLEHCLSGRNFFTGNIGSRLDYISFHKKGNASTLEILDGEWETIEYIRNKIGIPKNVPFYNDEADPMKNWAFPQQWRSDATYAAIVVKILLSHIEKYYMKNVTRDVNFGLLSNDNAFMSYYPYQFYQRTLLARFQINNTLPHYVDFVKKPVYTAIGLLSYLCPVILHSKVYVGGKEMKNMNEFGIVATHCPERNQIVAVLYNSADTLLTNVTFDINLIFKFSEIKENTANSRWIVLKVNNRYTNPCQVWKNLGMPVYPTLEELTLIKREEGPFLVGPFKMKGENMFNLRSKILNPGISLISICKHQQLLKKVERIRFMQIRNNSLQISWTDEHNRCLLTYNIEYSDSLKGPYVQLNEDTIAFPSYWHSCRKKDVHCSIRGFYRIYAVDYWHVHGPYSVPVKYSD